MTEILYKELSYAIVGAAMEVHRILGPGYLEAVYQAALGHEMLLCSLPFEEQLQLPVHYKGELVGDYIADFVIDGKIILELKAVTEIHAAHRAQTINYLASTGFQLAILLNFGSSRLQQERLVRFQSKPMRPHSK
jgi:GxxExxY protein